MSDAKIVELKLADKKKPLTLPENGQRMEKRLMMIFVSAHWLLKQTMVFDSSLLKKKLPTRTLGFWKWLRMF